MSAPLAVNTADGTCWTRRAVTRGGLALYAPEGVCSCPEFVMATLAELAEHGIVGSADVLPMPVGPEPQESGPRSFDLVGEVTADDYDEAVYAAEQAYSGMRGAGYTGSVRVDVGDERAPAEDVALHLPETALGQVQAILLEHYDGLPRPDMAVGLLLTNLRAELLAAPITIYRAEHPDSGITLGHYGTTKAAREHCETVMRRDIPGASLDWIEDDEDGVAELVAAFGEDERSTGYIVTALELASEYDEEADE